MKKCLVTASLAGDGSLGAQASSLLDCRLVKAMPDHLRIVIGDQDAAGLSLAFSMPPFCHEA